MRHLVADLLKNKYVGCIPELCDLLLASWRMNRWFENVKRGRERLRGAGDKASTLLKETEQIYKDFEDAVRAFEAAGPSYTPDSLSDCTQKLVAVVTSCTARLDAVPIKYGAGDTSR